MEGNRKSQEKAQSTAGQTYPANIAAPAMTEVKGKRQRPGDWVCPVKSCGDLVFGYRTACHLCGAPKPGPAPPGGKPGDWICPKKNCRDLVFARRNRCNRCGTPRPPRVVSTPIAAGGGPAATATAAGVEGAAAAGGAAGVATAAPQPQAAAGWQQAGAKVAVPAVTPKPAVAVAVAPPPVSDGWATVGKKAQAAKAKAQAAQTVAAPRGPASKGTSVPGAGAGAGAGTKAGDRTTPAANAASNSADFPGVNSTAAATATSSASATASKLNDEKAKRKRRRGKRGGTRTSEFSEEERVDGREQREHNRTAVAVNLTPDHINPEGKLHGYVFEYASEESLGSALKTMVFQFETAARSQLLQNVCVGGDSATKLFARCSDTDTIFGPFSAAEPMQLVNTGPPGEGCLRLSVAGSIREIPKCPMHSGPITENELNALLSRDSLSRIPDARADANSNNGAAAISGGNPPPPAPAEIAAVPGHMPTPDTWQAGGNAQASNMGGKGKGGDGSDGGGWLGAGSSTGVGFGAFDGGLQLGDGGAAVAAGAGRAGPPGLAGGQPQGYDSVGSGGGQQQQQYDPYMNGQLSGGGLDLGWAVQQQGVGGNAGDLNSMGMGMGMGFGLGLGGMQMSGGGDGGGGRAFEFGDLNAALPLMGGVGGGDSFGGIGGSDSYASQSYGGGSGWSGGLGGGGGDGGGGGVNFDHYGQYGYNDGFGGGGGGGGGGNLPMQQLPSQSAAVAPPPAPNTARLIPEQDYNVKICVVDGNTFWVHEESNLQLLTNMEGELRNTDQAGGAGGLVFSAEPSIGTMCVAENSGGKSRVVVRHRSGEGDVDVEFIDYGGITKRIPAAALTPLPTQFNGVHALAVPCRMVGLELLHEQDPTVAQKKAILNELLSGKRFYCKVVSLAQDGVTEVKLMDSKNQLVAPTIAELIRQRVIGNHGTAAGMHQIQKGAELGGASSAAAGGAVAAASTGHAQHQSQQSGDVRYQPPRQQQQQQQQHYQHHPQVSPAYNLQSQQHHVQQQRQHQEHHQPLQQHQHQQHGYGYGYPQQQSNDGGHVGRGGGGGGWSPGGQGPTAPQQQQQQEHAHPNPNPQPNPQHAPYQQHQQHHDQYAMPGTLRNHQHQYPGQQQHAAMHQHERGPPQQSAGATSGSGSGSVSGSMVASLSGSGMSGGMAAPSPTDGAAKRPIRDLTNPWGKK